MLALEPILDPGEEMETRLDRDFDGDGEKDIAYIARSQDKRELRVIVRAGAPARLALDPYPLGAGTLAFAKGVFIAEDLTGGTSALATIRRYRFDKPSGQMRLIGLDATYYSRTQAHDGFVLSWNLYTGKLTTLKLRLNRTGGKDAYDQIAQRTMRRPVGKILLANTPDAEALMQEVRGR